MSLSVLLLSGCLLDSGSRPDVASRTIILRPNADGGLTEISGGGGWVDIDEATADDDSSYVSSSQSQFTMLSRTELFGLTNPAGSVGTIASITVYARAKETAPAGRLGIGLQLPNDGESTLYNLTSSYANYSHTSTTSPTTGVAWTWEELDALQAGLVHTVQIPATSSTIRTTQMYVEVTYTLSDWNVAPSNVFSFSGDADTAIKEYLENTTITDSNVSTLITYLEATVGTYRVTPLDVPKMDESLSKLPLVYIWTTGLRAEFRETDTEQVSTTTRILVWAENNDPETSADEVQSICGAIASALQQTDKTQGSDWAEFYSNYGEPDVSAAEIQFIDVGDDVGYCRGELTVNWGHYAG